MCSSSQRHLKFELIDKLNDFEPLNYAWRWLCRHYHHTRHKTALLIVPFTYIWWVIFHISWLLIFSCICRSDHFSSLRMPYKRLKPKQCVLLLCSYVCVAFLRNEHNQIGHFTCMFFYHYSIIIWNSLKDGAQLQTIYGHFACETRCVHNQKLTRSTSTPSSTMFIFYLIWSHCKIR